MKHFHILILHLVLAVFMGYIASKDPDPVWQVMGIVLCIMNSVCAGLRIQMIVTDRRKDNETKTNHNCG